MHRFADIDCKTTDAPAVVALPRQRWLSRLPCLSPSMLLSLPRQSAASLRFAPLCSQHAVVHDRQIDGNLGIAT